MSKTDHLRNVPIFTALSDSDLNRIASKMVSRDYEKGQMILLEESTGETFLL
jgi:CRP-like cAMP-binding protein